MKRFTILALAACGLMTAGCQNLGLTKLKQSYLSVAGREGTIGSIFIWSNDVNAAVVYSNGQICAQRAMTAYETDIKASADLSAAVADLTTAAAAAAARDGASDESLLSLSTTIRETARMLTTTTERTAFLDVGLFYICQLSNNASISDDQTATLTSTLIDAAGGLE